MHCIINVVHLVVAEGIPVGVEDTIIKEEIIHFVNHLKDPDIGLILILILNGLPPQKQKKIWMVFLGYGRKQKSMRQMIAYILAQKKKCTKPQRSKQNKDR